jgi:hypothetical protein
MRFPLNGQDFQVVSPGEILAVQLCQLRRQVVRCNLQLQHGAVSHFFRVRRPIATPFMVVRMKLRNVKCYTKLSGLTLAFPSEMCLA